MSFLKNEKFFKKTRSPLNVQTHEHRRPFKFYGWKSISISVKQDGPAYRILKSELKRVGYENLGSMVNEGLARGEVHFTRGSTIPTLPGEDVAILGELHAEIKEREASRKRNKKTGKKEAEQARVLEKILSSEKPKL